MRERFKTLSAKVAVGFAGVALFAGAPSVRQVEDDCQFRSIITALEKQSEGADLLKEIAIRATAEGSRLPIWIAQAQDPYSFSDETMRKILRAAGGAAIGLSVASFFSDAAGVNS